MKNAEILMVVSSIFVFNVFPNGNNEVCQTSKCNVDIAAEVLLNQKCNTQLITTFINTLDTCCKNNAEFSEVSNSALFKLLSNRTEKTIIVLSKVKDTSFLRFIAGQVANPVYEKSDVKSVVRNLEKISEKYPLAKMFLDSANCALSKSYLK